MPKKKLYSPNQKDLFQISRSSIQSFLECPRCFYLDVVLGVKKPSGLPLPINMAIDSILKKEFDYFREKQIPHPEVQKFLIEPIRPYNGEEFIGWRKGAKVIHQKTNLEVLGKFDDVWCSEDSSSLYLADYKGGAVSASGASELHQSFRNQMDIYLWIAKQLDPRITNRTFFYYKKLKKEDFMDDSKFITEIVEYIANDDWVDEAILKIKKCLDSANPPQASEECKHCQYISSIESQRLFSTTKEAISKVYKKSANHKAEFEKLLIAEERLNEAKNLYVYPDLSGKVLQVVRELSEKKQLIGKSLEKGFDAVGLVIKPKDDKPRDLDKWYGYTIIESDHFRELTWMMNMMVRIFKDYFVGMEGREYLYDHIAKRMEKSLKKNGINEVFRDVLDEAEKLIKKSKANHLN